MLVALLVGIFFITGGAAATGISGDGDGEKAQAAIPDYPWHPPYDPLGESEGNFEEMTHDDRLPHPSEHPLSSAVLR